MTETILINSIETIRKEAFTITVKDWRKEKQVNLDQYIEVWLDHSRELLNLVNDDSDFDQVKEIQSNIRELATKNFWTLHKKEHG